MFERGGLEEEDLEDVRDGVHDLTGDVRPGEYEGASVVGGGMKGALSRIDGEYDRGSEAVEGW